MNKIIFISVHPIHYNDFLFNEISKSGVDIHVYYSNKSLKNYPWKEKMNYSFPAQDCEYFMKVDWNLIGKVITGRNTLFIVAGWESLFKNIFLFFLILFRRKYIVWTDTVKVDKQRAALKSMLRNTWLNAILGNAYRIFTTGEVGVTEMKRQFKGNSDKIVNYPFATDLSYFNSTPDFDNYKELPVLFSSGRLLNSHKGHDLAISALSRLKKEGYKFVYKIAGTGPDEAMLRELIQQNDLDNEVVLLGWQELGGLKENYSKAHILLHPSHFDPFPNAILESMASGLVIIASDKAGSAVERIQPGISGFIFPDNNEDALADTLRTVLNKSNTEMRQISAAAKATSAKWSVQYNINVVKEVMK